MEADTWTAAAVDQGGDSSSTEDVESPRSVVAAAAAARRGSGRWRWWRKSRDRNQTTMKQEKKEKALMLMHSQVVRIKEEEMQISEDLIGDHYSSYGYVADCHYSSDNDDDVWFRTSLPASPLGSNRSH